MAKSIPKWFTDLDSPDAEDYKRLYFETGLLWALNEAKYHNCRYTRAVGGGSQEYGCEIEEVVYNGGNVNNPVDEWQQGICGDNLPSEKFYRGEDGEYE